MMLLNMSLTILSLLPMLLMNLQNGQSDASIRCPFSLNCTNNNMKIIEIPTYPVPVKFNISYINYKLQLIELSDPGNCLPQLILDHNFSSNFPFKDDNGYQFPQQYNVSFFNCSSVVQLIRSSNLMQYHGTQDIISCPVYVVDSNDAIAESDVLVYCTKLFDRVSPFSAYSSIQVNRLLLTWSGTNFDIGCLKCKHKSKKTTFVILFSAGESEASFFLSLNFLFTTMS